MKVLTIRLPEEQYEKIKREADKRGLRIAQLIKVLLDEWLNSKSK